jgi:hypothetical protein
MRPECGRFHCASQDCGIGSDSMAAGLHRPLNARQLGANAWNLAYKAPAEVWSRVAKAEAVQTPQENDWCIGGSSRSAMLTHPLPLTRNLPVQLTVLTPVPEGVCMSAERRKELLVTPASQCRSRPKPSRWQIWEDSSRASHINEDPSLPPPNVPEDVRDISCGVDGLGNLAEHARGH